MNQCFKSIHRIDVLVTLKIVVINTKLTIKMFIRWVFLATRNKTTIVVFVRLSVKQLSDHFLVQSCNIVAKTIVLHLLQLIRLLKTMMQQIMKFIIVIILT